MRTTITMLILFAGLISTAQPGTFTNITATQRTDGSGLVDISFDLNGPALSYIISMEVSFNDGANYWPISASALSGDIQIDQGTGYHIEWDAIQSHPNRFSDESRIKLVANAVNTLNPCPDTPTVTDIDGNIYNAVQIGTQCWLRENLRTTRFRNGFGIYPQYKWYNDDISYKYQYGALYQWYAVNSEHGLCPEGWQVASREDWNTLISYVMEDLTGAAYYLKSCRQVNTIMGGDCDTEEHPRWDEHDTKYGIDQYGFSALPGGQRATGGYSQIGTHGNWWTRDIHSTPTQAWYQRMINTNNDVTTAIQGNLQYYSVRCIKIQD